MCYYIATSAHFTSRELSSPLGKDKHGKDIFLRDIWPNRNAIQQIENKHVVPSMFKEVYASITVSEWFFNKHSVPIVHAD